MQSSFDPTKLYGHWFEVAFIDIGQTGAACQMFNITASTQLIGRTRSLLPALHASFSQIHHMLSAILILKHVPNSVRRAVFFRGLVFICSSTFLSFYHYAMTVPRQ